MNKSDSVRALSRDYDFLSDEQRLFVDTALTGENILVDACIGSGKTTVIQTLCNMLENTRLNRTNRQPYLLYLTYNTLLKVEAIRRIKNRNIFVTNYHGFAYAMLRAVKASQLRRAGPGDLIQLFKQYWGDIKQYCSGFDVLLLDEYQDIDQEIAEMLMLIKSVNPHMQVIAVGDMCQKISDKTCLDIRSFIANYIGANGCNLEFTKCFRLSKKLAAEIGGVWNKKILGVNHDCKVTTASFDDTLDFLSYQDPGDILCLGANHGLRGRMQDMLETRYPSKFNKTTLWSKISDGDSFNMRTLAERIESSAIFTTYDSSKGMERPICVLFDWDLAYWESRISKPGVNPEIIKNIFLVAASRGKERIIFVHDEKRGRQDNMRVRKKNMMLSWSDLSETHTKSNRYEDMNISSMFDFKYIEHVEAAYKALSIRELDRDISVIDVPNMDGLIDLSPCIGIFQEVMYFDNTSIDQYVDEFFMTHPRLQIRRPDDYPTWSLDKKILYLCSMELNQARYFNQVETPFVSESHSRQIAKRLASELPRDAITQQRCQVVFASPDIMPFSAVGMCDVISLDKILYELKFVSSLAHVHFLQTAMYLVGHNLPVGRLWNVRNNQMFEITIPDREKFLNLVVKCVTKGYVTSCDSKQFDAAHIGEVGAFDYYNRTWAFCVDNFTVCEAFESKLAAGQMFNAIQVEQFFETYGLTLPVSGDLYLRYWDQMAEQIRSISGL